MSDAQPPSRDPDERPRPSGPQPNPPQRPPSQQPSEPRAPQQPSQPQQTPPQQTPPQPAGPSPWQPRQGPAATPPGPPARPAGPPAQPIGQPAQPRIPVQRTPGPPAAAQPPAATRTPPTAQTPPAAAKPRPPDARTPPAAQTAPAAAQPQSSAAQPSTAQPPAAQPPTAQPPQAATPPATTYTVPAIVAPWQSAATAGATAAGAAAGAGAAQAPAFPAAMAPDDGPPRGTVLQSQHALRDARRRALSHRLTALHAGWHLVTTETLRRLTGTSPGTGLILGVDQQRQPILVRLFRPAPTKVTLVGGVWAQRLLAFRALALGARVVLITTDPGAWQGFGELATGRSDRVALWNNPRPPVVPATAQQPALIICDTGAYGAAPLPEPRPWQTQLVVVRQLGADSVRALQDCDLVIMQRLAAPEASVAVQAMGLTGQNTQLLQLMGEDMLALLDGDTRYVWLSPTGIERQYNGAPRR